MGGPRGPPILFSPGANVCALTKGAPGGAKRDRALGTDPERAEQSPDAAAFYGSPTFLADEIDAALNGTPNWWAGEPWSDAVREQAINKGILRILYYWVLDEMAAAKTHLAAGEVDAADGAPHAWDEAWAFYMGAADDSGARPPTGDRSPGGHPGGEPV